MSRLSHILLPATAVAVLSTLGCAEPDVPSTPVMDAHGHDHDHGHEAPETFADAVAALATARDTIQAAFDADKPEDADEPLHDAPAILGNLAKLAAKAGLEGDQLKSVKDAVEDLMSSNDAMHEGMHGGKEGATFSDVAEKTNAAIALLQGLVGEDEHGHADDHDHDHAEGHDHAEEGHADDKEGDHHEDGHHDHKEDKN